MTTPRRTRLSAQDRRMQLLDCAMDVIQKEGLSGFTMEALAKAASVSNPLVYKYFDTRLELLQELLVRETKRFTEGLRSQVNMVKSYEDLLTVIVATNFDQFSNRNILNILRGQADVFQAIAEKDGAERNTVVRFLVKSLSDQYTVNRRQAEEILVLASGASQAAAAHYNQYGGNRDQMIKNTVTFILSGIEGLVG